MSWSATGTGRPIDADRLSTGHVRCEGPLFPVALGDHLLVNPVMNAAGCAGRGWEAHRFYHLTQLGAFVTSTVRHQPTDPDAPVHVVDSHGGVLHAGGVAGPGIDAFVREDLAWLHAVGVSVVVSVGGGPLEESAAVVSSLATCPYREGVVGIELNISSPHLDGQAVHQHAPTALLADTVAEVSAQCLPHWLVFVKLAADSPDVVATAQTCVESGATGITVSNALRAAWVNTDGWPKRHLVGALSGPSVFPLALRAVWDLYRAMMDERLAPVPLIGVGGITTGADALRMMVAGASAVQVGVAGIAYPGAPWLIAEELCAELRSRGVHTIDEIIGSAHRGEIAQSTPEKDHS